MKKFRFIVLFSLLICCVLAAFGCAKEKLSTPTDFVLDDHELVLSWGEVENATKYEISINGKKYDDSRKNSCSLEKLDEGTYEIRVKACDEDGTYKNSSWSKVYPFVREAETGMIYRLINNNTEYEVANLGLAEGAVTVPAQYRNKPVTSIGKAAFRKKDKLTAITLPETITNISELAFMNCKNLTTINIPSSVRTIGQSAFNACENLEIDLVIPEGVETIADSAFAFCGKISSVTFPSTLETIGKYAFSGCVGLSSVTFPNSLQLIDTESFSSCTSLIEIDMGTGLQEIGNSAFKNCSQLPSVTIGENVTTIRKEAFMQCSLLEEVEMSDKVTTIEASAFVYCQKLATVFLSDGLETLGNNVFDDTAVFNKQLEDNQADLKGNGVIVYVDGWVVGFAKDYSSYLTQAEVPTFSIVSNRISTSEIEMRGDTIGIATGVFAGVVKLTKVELPESVQYIGEQAFGQCPDLMRVIIGGGVKRIAPLAFIFCQVLQDVQLGAYDMATETLTDSSLVEICENAFYGCKTLAKIVIPETVEFIRSYAFKDTYFWTNGSGLIYAGNWLVGHNGMGNASVEIKSGTRGIADWACYGSSILEVVIPEGIVHFGQSAFLGSKVMYVTLPSDIKEIPEYTFAQCQQLLEINFPEGLETIGKSAFNGAIFFGLSVDENYYLVDTASDELVLPDSLVTIGEYAFYGCGLIEENPETGEIYEYGLDKIVFGAGLKTIGSKAFYKPVTVRELVFGDSLESIGDRAFYSCTALKKVDFGSSVQTIGTRAFYKCQNLTEIVLPDTLTAIEDYTFYKCESARKIVIGSGVTSIARYAFYACNSVQELYLPAGVNGFGSQAFRNAKALTSITLGDNIVSLENHSFYGATKATIYVEASEKPTTWADRWNTSFRPVVWGVTLDSEEGFVVSFTKNAKTFENVNDRNTINAPTRQGYVFDGWATTANGEKQYDAKDIASVEDGTTLYALWSQIAA